MPIIERNWYDLSHYSLMTGDIGRLQTLTNIPIIAGDSFDFEIESVFRLAPLRRDLVLDAKVDLYAFYVPYRHIYGDNWIDFIKQGIDEAITFSTITPSRDNWHWGGPRLTSGSARPLWIYKGYNQIWNRYFRPPTDTTNELTVASAESVAGDATPQSDAYGYPVARLKTVPTTGVDITSDASDRRVSLVDTDKIDILDLKQIEARYQTEQERDWFGQRYNDLLGQVFGSGVNIDADERPELCMRSSSWLSGYDVDGTADATLGTFSGKSIGLVSMNMPRKFFPEHGTLWIMATVRFPTIFDTEVHYLVTREQPTYKQIAGDPEILKAEPPVSHDTADFFETASTNQLGTFPYAQWYRYHPSVVHHSFKQTGGFPVINRVPSDKDDARLFAKDDYHHVFQSLPMGEWRAQSRITLNALRVIPGAKTSIFAGVS